MMNRIRRIVSTTVVAVAFTAALPVSTHAEKETTTGCAAAVDVGKRVFVPYTADYFFFRGLGD